MVCRGLTQERTHRSPRRSYQSWFRRLWCATTVYHAIIYRIVIESVLCAPARWRTNAANSTAIAAYRAPPARFFAVAVRPSPPVRPLPRGHRSATTKNADRGKILLLLYLRQIQYIYLVPYMYIIKCFGLRLYRSGCDIAWSSGRWTACPTKSRCEGGGLLRVGACFSFSCAFSFLSLAFRVSVL